MFNYGHSRLVARILAENKHRCWMVGGAVRDTLIGQEPTDIDLCTTATPEELTSIFDANTYENFNFYIRPIGIDFGTVRLIGVKSLCTRGQLDQLLVETTFELDISTLRQDIHCDGRRAEVEYTTDLSKDLARRDFTINAMASNIETGEFIDLFGGKKDLSNCTIRAVGDPNLRFQEDYLRMIRACRFTGYGDGYTIESNTWDAIKKHAAGAANLTKERLTMEVMKIMKTPRPSKCINALKDTNLLQYIIPPLVSCIEVDQNHYHAENVYDHCIMACDAIDKGLPYLRLAALLHDVGKPQTKDTNLKTGDIHFFNHEIIGASIAYQYMKEFHHSREKAEYVSLLIRHHMFRFTEETKRKTIKRWLNKTKGYHLDILELRKADRAGNVAKRGLPLVTEKMKELLQEIHSIQTTREPMTIKDLAISGKDLIALGFKPGPTFGKVLSQLLERILDEPHINNKEILLPIAKQIFEHIYNKETSGSNSVGLEL